MTTTAATPGISSQEERNRNLLQQSPYLGDRLESSVIDFAIDPNADRLTPDQLNTLGGMEIEAARIAISSVGSLAKINEVDHLGGGLDLIPALTQTLCYVDYEKTDFTIEHAHTSIGYYSTLAVRGYLKPNDVIDTFRRSLDIAGHVSWVPGGTQLNGGRLGVMIPAAVGQVLGRKARYGSEAWLVCHCGDAGWISGQALNGFNAADLHGAPITFVMHRNGIQLSGSNAQIMDKDPRRIVEAMGVTVIETASVHDQQGLFQAMKQAKALAAEGRPSMIYPVGYRSSEAERVDLSWFARTYGVEAETAEMAEANGVALNTEIWVPGALMSYRDAQSCLECLFFVNNLPGGKAHHDGHLKGRDLDAILSNPMLEPSMEQEAALKALNGGAKVTAVTEARPAPGTANLVLSEEQVGGISLPEPGKWTSARAGCQAGYGAVASAFPEDVFVIDCDLAPSTKVDKARAALDAQHQFEMSIEEQASAIMANGLACSSNKPQLVVFATFAAFFEGIAREGFEMWRYQRNLNGVNEGLNVTYHLSHVGACTGRDHFSGWSLDWIGLAMGYLPYLHRFYAPADARAAFIAVKDLAAHYGGHIVGIPRDNLPVLTKQGSDDALFNPGDAWEPVTAYRTTEGAQKAILAFGATGYLGGEAAEQLTAEGIPTDAYIVNGLPFGEGQLDELLQKYPGGLITIEDGLIANRAIGLRGFASMVAGSASAAGVPTAHIGIDDPTIAPSDGHLEVWEHFGITAEALVAAARGL